MIGSVSSALASALSRPRESGPKGEGMWGRAAILALMLLASACGSSPPTRFYTLDPVPAHHHSGPVGGVPVVVGKVTTPAALDRLSFVTCASANRLNVSDQDRWRRRSTA